MSDDRKRILFVQHSGGLGGAPRSLSFLVRDVDRRVYRPFVYLLRDGPAVDLFRESGIPEEDLIIGRSPQLPLHGSTVANSSFYSYSKQIAAIIPTYSAAKKIISRIKPDLVHINSTCMVMFAKAAKDFSQDIKVITHVREPLLANYRGSLLRYLNKKFTDGFISISHYDKSTLGHIYQPSEVIYNSVDLSQYNPVKHSRLLRNDFNVPDSDIVITFLARVSPGNGAIEFLKAAKLAFQQTDRISFFIVGMVGDTKSDYADLVRSKASCIKKVHILSMRRDVEDVIASSDVIVSPFTVPHFSRSVIEASAFGKAVIASKLGPLNEIVLDGKTGILYDRTVEGLAEAILVMERNRSKMKTMGAEGRRFAEANFDLKKNNGKVFDFYERILIS